jgi:hypothetical protein
MDVQREWLDLSYPQRVAAVIVAAGAQGADITEDQARDAVELDELVRAFGPGWEDVPVPYEVTEAGRRMLAAARDEDHDDDQDQDDERQAG